MSQTAPASPEVWKIKYLTKHAENLTCFVRVVFSCTLIKQTFILTLANHEKLSCMKTKRYVQLFILSNYNPLLEDVCSSLAGDAIRFWNVDPSKRSKVDRILWHTCFGHGCHGHMGLINSLATYPYLNKSQHKHPLTVISLSLTLTVNQHTHTHKLNKLSQFLLNKRNTETEIHLLLLSCLTRINSRNSRILKYYYKLVL